MIQHGYTSKTLCSMKEAKHNETYGMITLIWNVQNRQIYKDRKPKSIFKAWV